MPSTTTPADEVWRSPSPAGFRRYERTSLIGRGDDAWRQASSDVLRWAVKTRSGFRVEEPTVVRGHTLIITATVLGITVREPVEVVEVVEASDRVGFSYRTLPGHPVSGEEAFIVHRDGDRVLLTLRSLTAPAPSGFWRWVHPLLRLAQHIARRRYRRALRAPGSDRSERLRSEDR